MFIDEYRTDWYVVEDLVSQVRTLRQSALEKKIDRTNKMLLGLLSGMGDLKQTPIVAASARDELKHFLQGYVERHSTDMGTDTRNCRTLGAHILSVLTKPEEELNRLVLVLTEQ